MTGTCIPSLLLLALGFPGGAQERHAGDLRYEPYEIKDPDGVVHPGRLGRLLVPENRHDPDTRQIEIAFAHFRCTGEDPGPPIVLLAGGPGGSGIDMAAVWVAHPVHNLVQYGDVIALDQRGVGLSSPDLESPGGRFELDLPLDAPAARADHVAAYSSASEECIAYWEDQGVDWRAYTTEESADDVNDLRQALGAQKIVLYGSSYGSHLGLSILRRHPDAVARAFLSKVEGPDHTFKLPLAVQEKLEQLDERVRADARVREKVPDFLGLVESVLARLEEEPVRETVRDPATGAERELVLGKFDLQLATAALLGSRTGLARLPAFYYRMSRGDFGDLAQAALVERRSGIFSAMQMRMDAASGATQDRLDRIEEQAYDALLGDAINMPFPELCDPWGDPDLGDGFRGPFRCDVPVLFVSGALDARTPPANVEDLLGDFSNAAHVVVTNCSHASDELRSPEMMEIFHRFLRGEPVASTTVELPPLDFELP